MALANNAAFNVQQDLLGALNVSENILNLIKDGSAPSFRPSYKITVASSTGGKIFTTIASTLGFTVPRSYLGDEGSIFQSENGDVENIARANSMILNTGKGQVKSLITNVRASSAVNGTENPFRSGYAPGYNDNKGKPAITSADTKIYAFSTNKTTVDKLLGNAGDVINSLNFNREAMVKGSGFESPENNGTGPKGNAGYTNRKISDVGFTWTTTHGEALNHIIESTSDNNDEIVGDKKSLLVKTQKLFNSVGMKTLISVKGDMGKVSTQTQTANAGGFSKGSAVLSDIMFSNDGRQIFSDGVAADLAYCRSWTTLDRYDTVYKQIRNKALYDDPTMPYRFQTKNSVLEEGGYVKIAPYIDDKPTDPKKFMFSIENLAWHDAFTDLPDGEKGPGDLTTGKRGRIMWFPPYDINFTENNNVDWESNKFIGRGEPVYTYNNTERSGTLSFKIIVDHPSYMNAFKHNGNTFGADDQYIASFFAGCTEPNSKMVDRLTKYEITQITNESIIIPENKADSPIPPTATLKVYFPNDNAKLDGNNNYENGLSASTVSGPAFAIDYNSNPLGSGYGLGPYTKNFTPGNTKTWDDTTNFGLNYVSKEGKTNEINGVKFYGYLDPDYTTAMVNYLKNECKYCTVKVEGSASAQGYDKSNLELAKARGEWAVSELKKKWGSQLGIPQSDIDKRFIALPGKISTKTGCIVPTNAIPNPPTDTIECKKDRNVTITVAYDPNLAAEGEKALQPQPIVKKQTKTVKKEIVNKMYDETRYFERLTQNNKFVFDEIREKIRYFHPAFHSTTPEGLNSRLTFLLQCTRQGPTLEKQGATNLAFGRAPVCILRIGDFYHTKIVMDNVNIDYEPLQWDLNPEGIGVQPMIANVDITFKFIGGSSLFGPINKLQNALSFNYFANTHVYDPRADYLAKKPETDSSTQQAASSNDPIIPNVGDINTNNSQKSFGTYNIVNDAKKYKPEEKVLSTIITDESGKVIDQVAAEENVNGGVENATNPLPVITDEDVIKAIKIESYREVSEGDTVIQIGLGFYPPEDKPNMTFTLTSDTVYKGQLSLQKLNNNNVNNLHNIPAHKNSPTSVLFVGKNDVIVNQTDKNWVIDVPQTNDNITNLLNAKNDTSNERYFLFFKWDIASLSEKSSIGYNSSASQ